jgi:predicted homoserine dehydrogenase-like protein
MIGKEYVPIGLVEGSRVKKDIRKDEIISFENIECNTDGIIYKLWDLQKLS